MSANVVIPTGLTVAEIVRRVSLQKQISEATFWRLKVELGLSPIGARQRPSRYPAESVEQILRHFGIEPSIVPLAPMDTAAGRLGDLCDCDEPGCNMCAAQAQARRLVSLPKLKRIARSARKARAAG